MASIGAAFALSSVLPLAPTFWWGVFRWVSIAIASTVVLVMVERQTRRLLPLRTLLGLTLAFPDRAPSRFKIAIRTGTTNQLRQRLDEARAGKLGDTPSEAAERLLELVGMLSQHDRLTRGHSERVRHGARRSQHGQGRTHLCQWSEAPRTHHAAPSRSLSHRARVTSARRTQNTSLLSSCRRSVSGVARRSGDEHIDRRPTRSWHCCVERSRGAAHMCGPRCSVRSCG